MERRGAASAPVGGIDESVVGAPALGEVTGGAAVVVVGAVVVVVGAAVVVVGAAVVVVGATVVVVVGAGAWTAMNRCVV